VFRHKNGHYGRLTRNLQAGLMVHGFDIPLAQQEVFERAAKKSKAMLNSLGVELIPDRNKLSGVRSKLGRCLWFSRGIDANVVTGAIQ
jgi:hypothetical protein